MTPTIVTKNGKLAFVLGSPGGATIITTVANDLISMVDNGLDVQQAADAARFHHQYLPDRLELEKDFSPKVAQELTAAGYNVDILNRGSGTWGDSELIAVDPKTHELLGGHDHRHNYGKAAGY
jgi:gamma-glutamyltranspeptidase/glutathione hydrolase